MAQPNISLAAGVQRTENHKKPKEAGDHHKKNAKEATQNANCTLIVPPDPLSAKGLATPYQLTATNPFMGPCNEMNPNQAAFVQGAVFDPATNTISIYNPLVTDRGHQPAAQPVTPKLPANAVVALWFGFNGTTLTLRANDEQTLTNAGCVNGLGDSQFGQFVYCNAPNFFKAANAAISAGKLKIPQLGTAKDGKACPTVRDFSVVDQDQSDNVTTTYLIDEQGRTAQDTAANVNNLNGATPQVNGSDNRLLDVALDGALGCTPWQAPDLANPSSNLPALPLNELQAAAMQQQPIATVPSGDPMVRVNNMSNLAKQNLYRAGVDQSSVSSANQAQQDMKNYCQSIVKIQPDRIFLDRQFTISDPSPDPAAADNLFTFLAQRFNNSIGADGLDCTGKFGIQSPIHLKMNGAVAVDATPGIGNTNNGNNNQNGNQNHQHNPQNANDNQQNGNQQNGNRNQDNGDQQNASSNQGNGNLQGINGNEHNAQDGNGQQGSNQNTPEAGKNGNTQGTGNDGNKPNFHNPRQGNPNVNSENHAGHGRFNPNQGSNFQGNAGNGFGNGQNGGFGGNGTSGRHFSRR